MSFVVDATVALAWCFRPEGGRAAGPEGDYAARVLEALRKREGVVAATWTHEVSNGLLVAERRGRIRADEAARVSRLLFALPIRLDPAERFRAGTAVYRLARTRGLSVFDAAHLELAIRLALPIATVSRDLRITAGTEGVELFQPGKGV